MTVVINIWGGSGIGKSTTAAGLYSRMKLSGLHCELVREYVKGWAWAGKVPKGLDQPYLFGKQAHYESELYGKVDFLTTDSPLLVSAFYERMHLGREITLPAILNFMAYAEEEHGVTFLNFWPKRTKKFDPRGRYETAKKARQVDVEMRAFLEKHGLNLIDIECSDKDRPKFILDYVLKHFTKRGKPKRRVKAAAKRRAAGKRSTEGRTKTRRKTA